MTTKENNAHAKRIGIAPSKPNRQLTDEQIIKIRRIYSSGKLRQKDVAKIVGVSQSTVAVIVTDRRWKDIQPIEGGEKWPTPNG